MSNNTDKPNFYTLEVWSKEIQISADQISIEWENWNFKAKVNEVLTAIGTWINENNALKQLWYVLDAFNWAIIELVKNQHNWSYEIKKL